MKIIVFGATGQTGIQLVQQAIWKGHTVKAFGRNVFELKIEHEQLELVKGALFDEDDVYHAIKGCDAVLSVIGGASDGKDKTRSLGIKNIIAQMKKNAVQRIIALGGLGILNFDEQQLLIDQEDYPKEYLPVGNEHRKAYDYLKSSDLDWTFLCSPDIINEGPTGNYITNKDYAPSPNQYRINAGDLAQFMLLELEKNEYVKSRAGISSV